jgi:predicted metal-dependent phosphoesterase TrpH
MSNMRERTADGADLGLSAADLHMHTTCSDGAPSPGEVARVLERSSLDVAAVTDHDSVQGALRVREALGGRGPEIVIGTEVSTADGHVLALFVDRDLPAGRSAAETVELIHERGGLAVAVHPYFPFHSVGDLAARLPFDAVETANGTPLGEPMNALACLRLARSARAVLGGSDAHLARAIGHVRTLFPGRTAADLRAAIVLGTTRPVVDWRWHLAIAPAHLARAGRRAMGWERPVAPVPVDRDRERAA